MMLVLILIFCEKKVKNVFIIIWVYMQRLYILFCTNQFICKYRCLKAKVIKSNVLGYCMPKKYALYLYCLLKPSASLFKKCKYRTKKYKCPDL